MRAVVVVAPDVGLRGRFWGRDEESAALFSWLAVVVLLLLLLLLLAALLVGCASAATDGAVPGDGERYVADDGGSVSHSSSSQPRRADVSRAVPRSDGHSPSPQPSPVEARGAEQRVAASVMQRDVVRIDRERFRQLARTVPATVLEGRDFRSPGVAAQRFLRAVLRDDAEGWQQAVHLESPLVLGPLSFAERLDFDTRLDRRRDPVEEPRIEPASFSIWRTRLGRFDGVAGWGVTAWDVPEVAVFLAPVHEGAEVTVLRLRPDPRGPELASEQEWDGSVHEARSWRVYWVERTFEPATVVPVEQWVVRRFDEREAQPRYRGDEALQQPPVTERDLTRWLTGVVADARAERLDGVRARTVSDEERRATDPPAWRLLKDTPTLSQEALKRRLARIVQAPLSLEAVILLDQYQIAGSRTVFVRSLAVLGEAHQMRQAYRIDWRLAQGLYKIAHIEPVPLTPRLKARIERD